MELRSQFQYCPNSSALTTDQAKVANYSYVISGGLGLTTTLVLLSLLILYKAFKTALQRLFLYFTLAVGISDVIQVLNVELQFEGSRDFCSWLGFLGQWTSLSFRLLAIGLVLYISAVTFQKFRSHSLCLCSKTVSTKFIVFLEVLYLSAIILIPGAGLSVVLKQHEYGLSESTCWLKVCNDTHDPMKNHSSYYSLVNLSAPIFQTILLLALLVLMMMFHLTILKYQQSREVKHSSLCRSLLLFSIVLISMMAKLCEAAVNLHPKRFSVNYFYYDLFDELIQTIINNLLPFGFAVYLYSPKKLKLASMKKAFQEWHDCYALCSYCCRGSRVCWFIKYKRSQPSNDNVDDEDSNTFEGSVNYSTPSHTTYSTPYTNEFTEITEILSCAQEDNKVSKYGTTDNV